MDELRQPALSDRYTSAILSSNANIKMAESATWNIGDVILDQYEVMEHLGEGRMGIVQKLHHWGWNRDLAVKSLNSEIFAREGSEKNLLCEIERWVNLGLHPHIVQCYYARVLNGIPRIFTEYVAGSLATSIRKRTLYQGGEQRALERMLDIAIQFAWGLHAAHEQELIHQNVKPSNVLMTSDGIPKVTDFGLAKIQDQAGEVASMNRGQDILASSQGMTLAYCSPEQATHQPLTHKTDIWSWAVSILEMFVGNVTWTSGVVARAALAGHERLDALIPTMPPDMVKLLGRCFQPRPEDRPATLLEVAANLQSIYQRIVGQDYPRRVPRTVELLVDNLNNRALALYDQGNVEGAKQHWTRALEADPLHLESTYNQGLVHWRLGTLADDALIHQIEAAQTAQVEQWKVAYLLAQVHLERGDEESVIKLLQETARQGSEAREVRQLLERVQSGALHLGRQLHTFKGHTLQITSVCLSNDRRFALSGSHDKTLRLWEIASGQCLRIFEGHTGGVISVSLSADGRLALSGGHDKTLRLWEVASGQCLRIFEGHVAKITSVNLSTDGRLALSGSGDKTVRLWEAASGRCLRVFEGHTSGVTSVCLSIDSRFALSSSHDRTIRLWEAASGQRLRTFSGMKHGIEAVSMSADGNLALSGSDDNAVRLWEVASGQCLRTFSGHTDAVVSVSLSPDGRLALSGSKDKTVRLWEVASGQCLRTFTGYTGVVASVNLSIDGRLALSGSRDTSIQLWEVVPERFPCPFQLSRVRSHVDGHNQAQAESLLQQAEDALEKGLFAAALSLTEQIRVIPEWKSASRLLEFRARLLPYCPKVRPAAAWLARTFSGHKEKVAAVSMGADGRHALSGGDDNAIRLWEIASGRCLHVFKGHLLQVTSVDLSADGRFALSGSKDKTLRLWDIVSGQNLLIFSGHSGGVTSVDLSTDGRLALSGSHDKTLRLWDVASGHCLRVFEEHTAKVNSVCLSADGRFALSGSHDRTVRLWDVASGHCLRVFEGHTSGATSVCLSADGRFALSGSHDRIVRLWDIASGHCLRVFEGHTREIEAVNLSTDGSFAFSGSRGGTVRMWEVASGNCLRTFSGHTDQVTSVGLSSDGRWILSGSEDQALRLWEVDWEMEARVPGDWDEKAQPTLEMFLACHTPYAGTLPLDRAPTGQEIEQILTRRGAATWDGEDYQALIRQLQYAGFGWLRVEGVWRKLKDMAASWYEPPRLPDS